MSNTDNTIWIQVIGMRRSRHNSPANVEYKGIALRVGRREMIDDLVIGSCDTLANFDVESSVNESMRQKVAKPRSKRPLIDCDID